MLGMFICFVLPGIVVGALLCLGSKAAVKQVGKKAQSGRRQLPGAAVSAPAKGQLYVYDLKGDYTGSEAAA